jgi:Na+/proline symporter
MAMAIAIMGLVSFATSETGRAVPFDAEKVLPWVIAHQLPVGLKGVALAALIAAFMATFSAMVNGAASYLIRDIYQRYLVPAASPHHYVRASYVASVLMILIGIGISFVSGSINSMITWILGFLGSAVLLPNVLRWYWWRLTGYGFAAGVWTGMLLSLLESFIEPLIKAHYGYDVPVYVALPILAACSTLSCVIVTYLTQPPSMGVLAHFYRTTQPAGAWGPVADFVRQQTPEFHKEPFCPDLLSLLVALPWLGAMYVGPSYLVARQYPPAGGCGVIVLLGSIYLGTVWYRRLPARDEVTTTSPETAVAAEPHGFQVSEP